jgi:hypothetical protein
MHSLIQRAFLAALFVSIFFSLSPVFAQSAGNSGTIYGTVTDPSGAVIPGAKPNPTTPAIISSPTSRSTHTT